MTVLREGDRRRALVRRAGLLILFVLSPAWVFAQEEAALRAYHFTIGIGGVGSSSYDIGSINAQLRGNAPGANAPPVTLFTADSFVRATAAPEVRLGFALTRRIALEAGIAFARPRVGLSISGDPEAPNQELPGEKLEQYQFDAGLTWQLPFATRRLGPFISLGGGHLRQLHEDRMRAATGQVYYAGSGARYWLLGGSARSKALGLRGDLRVNVRRNGIEFENKMRIYPTASLSLFVGL